MTYEPAGNRQGDSDGSRRRLESWKEIAAYLGRDVRTVQRWEARDQLPVHRLRHTKLGSVFAYTAEIDAWRDARDQLASTRPVDAGPAPATPMRRRWMGLGIAAATAILVVVGQAGWRSERAVAPAATGAGIRSLAVLPLADLSGNPGQTYFADGMTEALIGRLSTLRGVRVISRSSVMRFRGGAHSVQDIASTLNVEAIVEGAVLRSGDRVRITAQLVDAETQENVWSRTYDRELRDVLTLQSEVAEAIGREIEATVAGSTDPARVTARSPVLPEAYESYLRARFHLNKRNFTRADAEESLRLFEQAIARDGTFAPAHAGLGAAYQVLGTTGAGALPVVETISKVTAAAGRALELDPKLGEAHVLLARAEQQAWRWAAAEAGYRRAIEIDANDVEALAGYGSLLTFLGRTEEGVSLARQARDLDPLTADRTVNLAWILYQARRYEEAIQELQAVLAAEPDYAGALWFLGFALIEVSRFDEAIQALERAAAIRNRNPATLGVLARAYGRAGRREEALRIVGELEGRARSGYVAPAVFVNAYMGIGDRGRVFAALERAYREHSNVLLSLKTHPLYDGIRDDQRFAELVRRVGLS